MLQVGSFPLVTHQTRGSAQGRAATLRVHGMCQRVVRRAAKLEDINVIAARCCVSVMNRGDEAIRQSSRKIIKTLLNN